MSMLDQGLLESELHLIGVGNTQSLTEDVTAKLMFVLGETVTYEITDYKGFANGETKVVLDESVRGKHVYLIADPNGKYYENDNDKEISFNDRFMQAVLILDAAKNFGAKTVNIVCACYPYSRQDKPKHGGNKMHKERVPSSSKLVADIFQKCLSVDQFITIDVHNDATANNFDSTNFINLYTGWLVMQAINRMKKNNLDVVLCPTDQGGEKKIDAIATDLDYDHAVVIKRRKKDNEVDRIQIFDGEGGGSLEGKDVLVHDDIVDTAGSLCSLIKEIQQRNPKSLNIVVTHGMFNGKAIEKLKKLYEKGYFEKIYISNSVYREGLPDFIEILDIGNIITNTIASIYRGISIKYNDDEIHRQKFKKQGQTVIPAGYFNPRIVSALEKLENGEKE